jgi:hypothetical protein
LNLLLSLAGIYLPPSFAKRRLVHLVALTADAFQSQAPDVRGLSYRESLTAFAIFSRDQAESCLRLPDVSDAVRSRLFNAGLTMGQDLRREFRVATEQDVASVLRISYKAMGIRFEGTGYGEIVIPRCLYSAYYSGPVCRVMQALDQGLASGLSLGGQLTFTSRITEGNPCCRANLEPPPVK